MALEFEWDADKARTNLRKHGVSFEEASTVFYDELSATGEDPDHSLGERRFITIGVSSAGRLLAVAHTDSDDIVRVISAKGGSGRRKADL